MTLNAGKIESNSSGMKAELLDPGAYPARVVQILDIGVQPQEFKGEKKAPKNEVWITYELLDEFMVDENGDDLEDKPRWLSERFPLNSLDSDLAKSTKRYYALDSEGEYEGDWSQLLGMPCMVNVSQYTTKGQTKNKVQDLSAMRAKEAKKAPELVNEARIFTLDDPDMEVYESLPEFLQTLIKESLEVDADLFEGEKPKKKKVKKEEPKVEDEDDDGEDW